MLSTRYTLCVGGRRRQRIGEGSPQRMPRDWNQGLYFMLGLLLAFYFLAPFLELGLR